jgi:hypothetical protein
MVIPNAVAYGVLASVGLLILLAFVVVFMRLERAPKRIEEDRPPMPVGWPTITPAVSATSPVKPVRLRALWRRSHRS